MPDPFDKWTQRAREVMTLAHEEACEFGHNYIGTEHLLLGLIREGGGIAARTLEGLGVQLAEVRASVEYVVGRGETPLTGELALVPRAKKVLKLAGDEARRLNHHYIGTEHLLLALLREGEGVAAGVLEGLGVTLNQAHAQVELLLASGRQGIKATVQSVIARRRGGGEAGAEPKGNVLTCRVTDRDLGAIDALVESGIRSTRSDAASWLIGAGIEAHKDLFDRVNATIGQIRALRSEAQAIAQGARGAEEGPAEE